MLTPENRDEVLARFFHRSRDEAREVVAELKPVERAPVRDVVTAVSVPLALPTRTAPELAAVPTIDGAVGSPLLPPTSGWLANLVDANIHAPAVNAPTSRAERDAVEPLTAERSRLHVTVSRRFLEKLEAAREALSHSHPAASTEAILEAGLDLVLAQSAKRKGLVENPRKARRPAKPEHIPAAVRRAVWMRDGGCCQWELENGGICGSRHRLQLDHIRPRALGGASTIENLRVLCAPHNLLAARLAFGDAWMDRFTKRRTADPPCGSP